MDRNTGTDDHERAKRIANAVYSAIARTITDSNSWHESSTILDAAKHGYGAAYRATLAEREADAVQSGHDQS